MAKLVKIEDPTTTCCFKFTFSNAKICFFLGFLQLLVASVALAQHVYSLVVYNQIFLCYFGEPKPEAMENPDFARKQLRAERKHGKINRTDPFLAADVIIFDFGLFHYLLGIPKCVANQFDGGYMRAVWCVSYVFSLTLLLAVIALQKPRPKAMLPILLQQSIYMLGLIMLTLATIRKLIWALFGDANAALFRLIMYYTIGGASNCYLGITLWHLYWYWKNAVKGRIHSPVDGRE